jgi:hypothetical protein
MTAAILLVGAFAMLSAVGGRRDFAVGLFAIALVASVLWLDHHMTEPLKLAF